MNAAPAAPSAGTLGRLVGGAVMLVVAAVLLYYLYDYMFNVTQTQVKAAIVPSPIESPTTMIQYPGTTQTDIKLAQYVFTGGEMAITFWMYVTGDVNTVKHDSKFAVQLIFDGESKKVIKTILNELTQDISLPIFELMSSNDLPFDNTLLPIFKRKVLSYIVQKKTIVNLKKN